MTDVVATKGRAFSDAISRAPSTSAERPRLSSTDLNLFVAFDALVAEGNVTRAAERVGLTQPAMSHALARLRKLIGDPLFVRTSVGMSPTPRALELVVPVRRALGEIDRALREPPAFDPASAERSFTLAAVDFGSLVVLPPLLARLRKEAPGVDLMVRQLRNDAIERQLAEDEVDVAIGVLHDEAPPWMIQRRLFDDGFVCVVRADHPTAKGPLTLEEYLALDHALIAPRGKRGGYVDRELTRLGKKRRVVVTVPHFLVAPVLVAESDLVLTLPERVAKSMANMLPLRIIEPPIELRRFSMTAYWHERQSNDPAHGWLRGVISEVCKDV
jgi:DNA-binding transcriptional LysR family regulator